MTRTDRQRRMTGGPPAVGATILADNARPSFDP